MAPAGAGNIDIDQMFRSESEKKTIHLLLLEEGVGERQPVQAEKGHGCIGQMRSCTAME